MRQQTWMRLLGMGLLLSAAGCDEGGGGDQPRSLRSSSTSLTRAQNCDDLLTKIQADAIAKLDLAVEQYKQNLVSKTSPGGVLDGGVSFGGIIPPPSVGVPASNAGGPEFSADNGAQGSTGGGLSAPRDSAGESVVGASETNTQVKGVDEADFVKLVESGKGMFLLHGNTLRKLTTFPAEQLALNASSIEIEGQPSELFITDSGKAVVFSSVYNYGGANGGSGITKPGFGGVPGIAVDLPIADCGPGFCGGYGLGATKITIIDVSTPTFQTERELYYQGSYISSRRYNEVVRVVLQGQTTYGGLYSPSIQHYDSFGRPYSEAQIDQQLAAWRERVAGEIKTTTLADWVPQAKEAKAGKLVDVAPDCDTFFVPQPGLADYGLTHVLSVDVSKSTAPVGGVTVMGQSGTVYSSLDRLVLAQPDYRWSSSRDFGVIDEQRTSLHVFSLTADKTNYLASGWVPGNLPSFNPQFGIDVTADHTLRIATTGSSRKNPDAEFGAPDFWERQVNNHVFVLREEGGNLSVAGKSDNLGHVEQGETIHSARFVGSRAYVVTFRQTDPLIVLDVSKAADPKFLGQVEIPGFSQYMHPLDENHLITFGQSGTRTQQLQLFDVSDPSTAIPQPKVLDFGAGGWSEVANNHKAFTFYAPKSLIALPVSGYQFDSTFGYSRPVAGLQVVEVHADTGFKLIGSVDHSSLVEEQSCVCDAVRGCYGCNFYSGVEMRRGHFVETTDDTYVYGISHAGVSVNTLGDLDNAIESVVLPAPKYEGKPWYEVPAQPGADAGTDVAVPRDGGTAVTPTSGGTSSGSEQDAGAATKG